MNKNVVIVGATSEIAQEFVKAMCSSEDVNFFLIGRDRSFLDRIASDVLVRNSKCNANVFTCDFLDPISIFDKVKEISVFGNLDIVLIAHGSMLVSKNLLDIKNSLFINGVSPILFAEAFRPYMNTKGNGVIAILGSVAGDRGRKNNYIYGSAKAMLERYIEGMQHKFFQSEPSFLIIKLGPTNTKMFRNSSSSYANPASPNSVGYGILRAIRQKKSLAYIPVKWGFIMFVISNIPRWLFNRLDI